MNKEKTGLINCVGFIMDGNRRWARERNLPTLEGHKRGYDKVKAVLEWCRDEDIEHVALYAFSIQNWERSKSEVSYLMKLFEIMTNERDAFVKDGVRVHVVGDTSRFDVKLKVLFEGLEDATKEGTHHLWITVSYGGREEILASAQKLADAGLAMTAENIEKNMWSYGMPEPDLIIRTGGEQRLSNFMTWKSAYSELMFIDAFWPGYEKEEFKKNIAEYNSRQRRFGK